MTAFWILLGAQCALMVLWEHLSPRPGAERYAEVSAQRCCAYCNATLRQTARGRCGNCGAAA